VIDPAKVCLFIPEGLKRFKLDLFNRIGGYIEKQGGQVVRHDASRLAVLPDDVIPIVGCQPESTDLIIEWRRRKRQWIYWDRGYFRRWFAVDPANKARSLEDSYYRWHLDGFQLRSVQKGSDERWKSLGIVAQPWRRQGGHIVIAAPSKTYAKFHRCETWLEETLDTIARITNRQLVIRHKEQVLTRPLSKDLEGAHCLVAHASIAAVESVMFGCPVFVHPDSAAALVGKTNLKEIEKPVYPEREAWFHSLAASQWNERELVDGTLWRSIT